MLTVSTWFQNLGFVIYAAPILIATCALSWTRAKGISPAPIVRRFQSIGPILGISLGICILGFLGTIWLQTGTFSWSMAPGAERVRTITHALFFVAWVSNIKLEIWTLEPLRANDPDSARAAYNAAVGPFLRHMCFQSVVLISVLALSLKSWN